MTDDSSAQSAVTRSDPPLLYRVRWGDKILAFQDVTGLDRERKKSGNLTMLNGIWKYRGDFWRWFDDIRMNASARKVVMISLLDEAAVSNMEWTLRNVWPLRICNNYSDPGEGMTLIGKLDVFHEGIELTAG